MLKKLNADSFVKWALYSTLLISAFTTLAVVFVIGRESFNFFSQVGILEFISGTRWEPLLDPKSFGVLPLVCGTALVVFGSALIALPMGIAVAIFLNEFAGKKLRRIIKPILEILAGIPTVVFGYFALTFITPVLKSVFPSIQVFNALSGAIVVGIMILPMIASLTDDALRDLPNTLREGAYALGATHFETITQILIPASLARIGAVTILAISRAIGETMAVTLAAGATPNITLNFSESIQTLTAYIVQVSLGDVQQGGIEYLTCYAVGGLLFVMTFTLNVMGHKLISRARMVQL
ncbi:MAG: phosphate ABC transporter permease subunit PstC [Pseudomonadota bacterium]|nr:phosphate ABC transporter permease subunit PstC [Pseudomonadota bacterium]